MVDEASRAAVGDLLLDHYGRRHHHLVHHTDRGAPGDEHAFDAGQRGPNGDGVPQFLMLFLSLGLVKLAFSYGSLSKNSESSEKAADRALQARPDELGAFKVMYDYHLHRAAGPLLPTWLWKMRKDELNQTWQEHRCGAATQ
jgi:hypothetical protein